MAEAPVPDRPNIQSNVPRGLRLRSLVSRRCAHPDDESWAGYLGCCCSVFGLAAS
jgi:hypothetical protein